MSLMLATLAALIIQPAPVLDPANLPPNVQIIALNVAPPVVLTNVPASGDAAPPTPHDLAGPEDQTICKLIATTGTRFMRSQCRTRAEWNALGVYSRQATLGLQSGQNGFNNAFTGHYNGK